MGAGEPQAQEPTASWLGQTMPELERKRAVLAALNDSLSVWEQNVDWEGLAPEKQAALLALAEESVRTLKSMIARLEAELAEPGSGAGRDG